MKMNSKITAALAHKMKSINARALVAAITVAPFAARAAEGDIDVAPIVAKIVSMGTAAGVIGLAYLTVVLGVKAFKLLRSAA